MQAILSSADVIPFRFPTLMADEAQLVSEIREHAAQLHRFLARVRGRLQMEARISPADSTAKEISGSGAEYLRARREGQRKLEMTAAALKTAAAGVVRGWQQRISSAEIRCFVLVERKSVGLFQAALGRVHVPPDLVARISGPWPPTEFFGDQR
jgi:hypothetical protein